MRATHRHTALSDLIEICDNSGCSFEAARSFDLAGGASAVSLFVTGSRPVILFSRQVAYNDVGVNAYSYRDPSVTSTGSAATDVHNANDFFTDLESTVKLYGSPVVTNNGIETRSFVEMFNNESNQGKGSPIETINRAHRIPPNKIIAHVISNRSANQSQHVYARLAWIEPQNIPGLEKSGDEWVYRGIVL